MAEENTQAEDTFISHLIELRSRIVKAAAVVLVVFLCLMPFAAHIFDVLAAPMIHA
ncbi:twin-arginine translocase subunit TatC, partial [Herbaspirillum sp. B65]